MTLHHHLYSKTSPKPPARGVLGLLLIREHVFDTQAYTFGVFLQTRRLVEHQPGCLSKVAAAVSLVAVLLSLILVSFVGASTVAVVVLGCPLIVKRYNNLFQGANGLGSASDGLFCFHCALLFPNVVVCWQKLP